VTHRVTKITLLLTLFLISVLPFSLYADTKSDLEQKIAERNQAIKALEQEIAGVKTEIDKTSTQAQSLQAYIKTLDLTINKLRKDSQVTENQIAATTYKIEDLKLSIEDKTKIINQNRQAIALLLRDIRKSDDDTVTKTILGKNTLSTMWNTVETTNAVTHSIQLKTVEITQAKDELETNRKAEEKAKGELEQYKKDLVVKQIIISANKKDKAVTLKETKNKESAYKTLLDKKQALKDAFENELTQYEADLKLAIDSSKLPSVGSGVLSWPLDVIKITQYFGNTPFATKNPQVYSSRGHNGVDFKASIGTKIKAALSGVVAGTGNTDNFPGCYSYGKWVMITHGNGLSTLYAHLSYVAVNQGDKLVTGQVIGYSGNTGYSTGPHLHFGVYASQGVQIITYSKSKNCHNAVIPIADPKAYLNPLSYL
jgi:murein DD-endopeptidase MepM/ murein hydrolase activator NlpD